VEIVVNKEGVGSGVLAIDSLVCCSLPLQYLLLLLPPLPPPLMMMKRQSLHESYNILLLQSTLEAGCTLFISTFFS
jgi:hypothetical protein